MLIRASVSLVPAQDRISAINGDDIVFARDMLSDLRRLWPTQNNELPFRIEVHATNVGRLKKMKSFANTTLRGTQQSCRYCLIVIGRGLSCARASSAYS
jgi:hypothetical protein